MKSNLCILLTVAFSVAAAAPAPSEDWSQTDAIQVSRQLTDRVYRLITDSHLHVPFWNDHSVRSKRQVNLVSSQQEYQEEGQAAESERCVLQCNDQLIVASRPFLRSGRPRTQQRSSNTNIERNQVKTSSSHLNSVCAALRPAIECFDRCGSSSSAFPLTLTHTLRISLDPIKFICVDRLNDFKANVRCMQKISPVATSRCSTGCQSDQDSVARMQQLANSDGGGIGYPRDQARQALAGTCQYIKCFLGCSVPLTRAACGSSAGQLITGITKRMMTSLQHLDAMTTADGANLLPETCAELAQLEENYDGNNNEAPEYAAISSNAEMKADPESEQEAEQAQRASDIFDIL